jgi:hypothetical protein
MMKHWLAGAAAFAMMTGVALAEDRPAEATTTTRSTTTVPAVESHKWSETHRGTDRDGYATRSKRTYHSNAHGSTVTSRIRTVMPDGSRTMSRERETTPYSGSSIEKKTTTTIDR